MTGGLLLTALAMGLAGSPHCAAMCGAPCASALDACRAPANVRSLGGLWLGRTLAYASAGAVAAASAGALRWAADTAAWLRPLWSMAQFGAFMLGVALLWLGRQPRWFEVLGERLSRRLRQWAGGSAAAGALAPGVVGVALVALPCGLLYSALLVAALASTPAEGAAVMAAFSLASGVPLVALPWLWQRWQARQVPGRGAAVLQGRWATRLAGAMLAAVAGFALVEPWWHPFMAWCGAVF